MSKVLVVDGDLTARTVLAATLARAGFEVRTAATLREAREAILEERITLLLLELELPDGHGLDLLREIRGAGVRAVVVTSMHQHAYLARSRSLGAVDYVTKPFSPRELVERLRSLATAA
ncbi:MAG: response regulator [Deltaproteobacteria bacterium]|nr:response regulator [Deltaproteobacteria bacterium]